MEIGKTIQPQSLKTKLISATLSGALFTIVIYLLNQFITPVNYSLYHYLFQGVLFGAFMGFAMPWLMTKYGFGRNIGKSIKAELSSDEEIEYEGPANLFRGMEGVGGKLFLTSEKVIFVSHKFNIQKGQTNIKYSDIIDIEPRKTAKLIDNGIRITTKDPMQFDFVVNDRDQWVELIRKKVF